MNQIFQRLENVINEKGQSDCLQVLADHFRTQKNHAELFEVLKMQARDRMGLPVVQPQSWMNSNNKSESQLPADQQRELEDQLLAACRDVGTLMVQDGQIAEGWVYLEPLGDDPQTRKLFERATANDDNLDVLIDVTLGQRANPRRGFELLIQQRGTCNAITTFESFGVHLPYADQQQLATVLLDHVYKELKTNVARHLKENEKPASETASLRELTKDQDWLFENSGHHLDVTHLASTVRLARVLEEKNSLTKALEISEYGDQLSENLKLPGQPPFEETFRDHAIFFNGLLRIEAETATDHFRQKSESETGAEGMLQFPATEQYVMLLHRLGKTSEAIDVAIKHLAGTDSMASAWRLMELTGSVDDLQKIQKHCQEKSDVLTFGLCLLQQHGAS